ALIVFPSARFVPLAMPIPDNATVVGLADALLVIATEPVRVPAAVGRNVTLIVQLPPAARLAPQVLVCAKSPLALIAPIAAALVPGFCSVIVCGGLVEPTLRL